MEGLAAEKKKKERALMDSHNQYSTTGRYTVLNDQYSQLNSLIKKGFFCNLLNTEAMSMLRFLM